jgi:hypothetical protein
MDGQVLVSYTDRAAGVTHMYEPCVVVADGGCGVNTQPAAAMLRTLHHWIAVTVRQIRHAAAAN